jgi:hypothetical protein
MKEISIIGVDLTKTDDVEWFEPTSACRQALSEFPRWSNANPEGVHRIQPFGGVLSDFREVQGFLVPFHVEAGNWFGTDDYFPFFTADLTEVLFPIPASAD